MKDDEMVGIYSGTESSVLLLKGKLERIGISAFIGKDSNAGSWGIVPDNIDLLIRASDRKNAEPVIQEFMHNDKINKM